jgi:cyclic pyranopterin phosphate synthase
MRKAAAMKLSHLDACGNARMVDVSAKRPVRRTARARAGIRLQPATLRLIREGLVRKGDVLNVARLAGIAAAKKTWDLIPLCHPISLDRVDVDLHLTGDGIEIESTAACTARTGVEMEALTAVSVAALAVYDMCKAVDKTMIIRDIMLVKKTKSAPLAR